MKKHSIFSGLINFAIGILFLVFFISVGLCVAIYVRPLYYIHLEELSAQTGAPVQMIKENYDALIDWCSPFARGELSFPSLPASESGISHFVEVKVIFNLFFAMLFVCPVFLAGLIYLQHKRGSKSYLLASPIIVCVLPLVVAAACSIDFSKAFVIFHKIMFRNDDWLFSPYEDPIILFLPESFFLQCALVIVATVLLGCAILWGIYAWNKKKINQTKK